MAHENGTNRNLSELFAHARTETPVVSREDIDALLDDFDLHGRQGERSATESAASDSTGPINRGRIMGMISTVVIGAVIGAGSLIYSGGEETSRTPATEHTTEGTAADMNLSDFSEAALQMPIQLPSPRTIAAPSVTAPVRPALHVNPKTPPVLQGDESDDPDQEIDRQEREMGEELGRFVTEFWDGKINQYRRAIDRAVSGADLAALNRLRIRWSLLEDGDRGPLNFQLSTLNARSDGNGKSLSNTMTLKNDGTKAITFDANVSSDAENSWTSDGTSKNVTFDIDADIKDLGADDAVFISLGNLENIDLDDDALVDEEIVSVVEMDDNGKPVQKIKKIRTVRKSVLTTSDNGEENTIDSESLDRTIEESERVVERAVANANEMKAVVSSLNIGSMGEMLKMAVSMDQSESSRILQETWEIAERSRDGLDPLKAQIMEDIATFEKELKRRVRAIAKASDLDLGEAFEEDGTMVSHSISDEVLGPLYDVIAEPMLMLYNGSDITPVLTSAIAPPVPGMVLEAHSTLSQSFPNPAQESATIEFRLDAPSNGTTLRLFDVTGSEIEVRDLGTLPAGTHSEVIDVSNLPSGTYLYHLTVETPEGSRVYSKSLDVIN